MAWNSYKKKLGHVFPFSRLKQISDLVSAWESTISSLDVETEMGDEKSISHSIYHIISHDDESAFLDDIIMCAISIYNELIFCFFSIYMKR